MGEVIPLRKHHTDDHPPKHSCYTTHGCACAECSAIHAEWMRRYRRDPRGYRLVPAERARERLRALAAAGWTYARLERETGGLPVATLRSIAQGRTESMERDAERAIIDTFERLSMTVPERAGVQPRHAGFMRAQARARGWLKPLELDDL